MVICTVKLVADFTVLLYNLEQWVKLLKGKRIRGFFVFFKEFFPNILLAFSFLFNFSNFMEFFKEYLRFREIYWDFFPKIFGQMYEDCQSSLPLDVELRNISQGN